MLELAQMLDFIHCPEAGFIKKKKETYRQYTKTYKKVLYKIKPRLTDKLHTFPVYSRRM